MAMKKKKGFDAVAASRRWRVGTARRLAGLTPDERRAHLRRTKAAFFARRPRRPVALR